ncbi:MAG: hypothetical protein FJX29_13025, partial [Alphaproteobacteria bacterium]|nr:hypothetical protein [Alphaproteobacteria bacterium]
MTAAAFRKRREALASAMQREDCDLLVLIGNNWHADYLRYATDFGIQEGNAVVLVRPDGASTLLLDDPAECERARTEAPGCEIIHAPKLVEAARAHIGRAGIRALAASPMHLLPWGLAKDQKELRIRDGAAVIERLL